MAEPTQTHYEQAVEQLGHILEFDSKMAGTTMLPQAATQYYASQANGIAIAQLRATLALVEAQNRLADTLGNVIFDGYRVRVEVIS